MFTTSEGSSAPTQSLSSRLVRAISAGLAYLLLARASLQLVYPYGSIANIWPPSGLALGLLLVSRPSNRGLMLFAFFGANTLANLAVGSTLAVSLGFAAANCFETFLCLLLLSCFGPLPPRLKSIPDFFVLALSTTFGIGIAALTGAALARLAFNADYWANWLTWLVADGIGVMMVTPFILAWTGYALPFSKWKPLRIAEGALVALLFLTVTALMFLTNIFIDNRLLLRSYILFPILLWAAARFDQRYITTLFLPGAVAAIWGTARRLGIFFAPNIDPHTAILTAQIFLGAAAISMHLLNIAIGTFKQTSIALHKEIDERQRAETELRSANQELQQDMDEIEALQENLRDQAVRDALTGLYNRRYLLETIEREIAEAVRGDYPLSLLMLDIDHFKAVNDTFGHKSGDEVLIRMAQLLTRSVREGDIVCRYGGEEFLVVMIHASEKDASERAEILRQAVSEIGLVFSGVACPITCSVGVAAFPRHSANWERVIARADAAMYRAKQDGRNRVVLASAL